MQYFWITICLIFTSLRLTAQGVGIGPATPTAALDVQGDLILRSADLVLPDGVIYNADVITERYNLYKLSGPTGNFALAGILAAENDRMITLYNRAGHSMEIYNEDANAAPGDMIYTGTGTTFAIYPGGSVTLRYDATLLRWEIVASHYNSLDYFGGTWAASANDIYNTNSGNVGVGTSTPMEKLSIEGNMDITGEIKTTGAAGQSGEVLQSNGNGTMSWMPMSQNQTGDVGYGSFGCDMNNVTDFNPVFSESSGSLGNSVDIQGDFAIIGASGTSVNGVPNVGAAYIYHYDGTNWLEQQRIIADDGQINDKFGWAVAIYGPWAVVANNVGGVYVFQFNGVEWVQTQKIVDNNGGTAYGFRLSMDDSHIAIADINDNSFAGAIDIYAYSGPDWVLQHHVVPGDGMASDNFGYSVSIEGSTMIVGSVQDDDQAYDGGSVYYFFFDGANWIQQQKFYAYIPGAFGFFGLALDLSGNNLIVGSGANKVEFFRYENGEWRRGARYSNIESQVIGISGNLSICPLGKIFKSTPQYWFIYETVDDPNGTSQGAIFSSCAIENGKFVIGAPTAVGNAGMAIFGKVRE